jgi:hypothetical protein
MRKYTLAVMTVVMVLALFWVALAAVTPTAQAGPLAAPTPAISGYSAKAPTELTWWDTTAVTADGGSTALVVSQWQAADVQYVIDQGDVNTVTLKLQFSNDNVNWTDGATLVSANEADASVLAQAAVFGKYARVYADVNDTDAVTLTVIGILK